jgi:hypothetical protein
MILLLLKIQQLVIKKNLKKKINFTKKKLD